MGIIPLTSVEWHRSLPAQDCLWWAGKLERSDCESCSFIWFSLGSNGAFSQATWVQKRTRAPAASGWRGLPESALGPGQRQCPAWPFAKCLLPWPLGGQSLQEMRCFSGVLIKEMDVKWCFLFRHDTLRCGECCVCSESDLPQNYWATPVKENL